MSTVLRVVNVVVVILCVALAAVIGWASSMVALGATTAALECVAWMGERHARRRKPH